jgi:hypothetical protein
MGKFKFKNNRVKCIAIFWGFWSSISTFNLNAQTTIDVSRDLVEVTSTSPDSIYAGSGTITFTKLVSQFTSTLLSRGLQFKNGAYNYVDNKIQGTYINGSIILGAQGTGTTVHVRGEVINDFEQARPSLVVFNQGRIILGKTANVDLILAGSYFTRQFWVHGDGTGILELEDGFIADKTNFGTTPTGIGSIRLSNVQFRTHNSLSLPLGYRPGGTPLENGTGAINSHLVFTNAPGSVWQVRTNDQTFRGGIWVEKDMCFDTEKKLTITGENAYWLDYTNFGGIQVVKAQVKMCKKGKADLEFKGTQSYNNGAWMQVQEGKFILSTNPSSNEVGKDKSNRNDLSIQVSTDAILEVRADSVRIDSLILDPGAIVHTSIGKTLKTNLAQIKGKLKIEIPNGINLSPGTQLKLFDFGSSTGQFDSIQISNFGGSIVWDYSELLSRGILKVQSGQVITGIESLNEIQSQIKVNGLQVQFLYTGEVSIFDIEGKRVYFSSILNENQTTWNAPHTGLYFIKTFTKNKESKTYKIILKEN